MLQLVDVGKKLEVVPEEAVLVRKIFGDYLAGDRG
jgi:hypothetical protein